jgi:pyruvate dehydrogenase E2 component (dihydrolipoamide acetyltransferase)
MGEFRMPSLGADMDVGTIVEWLVKPGDAVTRGQIVAVVDTAKAAIDIEAFESGVVERILVGTGVQVPVGTPLAIIGAAAPAAATPPSRATPPVRYLAHQLGVDLAATPGSGAAGQVTHDDLLAAAARAAGGTAGAPPRRTVEPGDLTGAPDHLRPLPTPQEHGQTAPRLRATPRARRIAAERGIDLRAVTGSGNRGAILAADVQQAAVRGPASPVGASTAAVGTAEAPVEAVTSAPRAPSLGDRKSAMRTAIANLMTRSNAEIPHYYVTRTLDVSRALTWLREHNAALPPDRRLLPAVLFLRATVLAAVAVPDLNGHWIDGELRPSGHVDLGVAVATRGGGLVTPTIPDAGALQVDELMARLTDLVRRARRGTLRQAEMAAGSITVSSLGEEGSDALYGVIFPPQVALVGVGRILERPWAVDGMLTVRPTVMVVLAADHRASDGRTASAFLAAFAHALDHPEEM